MPSPLTDSSRSAHHTRSRTSRNQPVSASDPKPRTHFLCKPIPQKPTSISALFNHRFASSNGHRTSNASTLFTTKDSKKYNFKSGPLGGLGCGTSSPAPVSAPAFIRSAADWEAKKVRKKKQRKMKMMNIQGKLHRSSPDVVEVVPDVCCGPGIAFASDAALVDCVESRRPVAPRTNHRQRSSATRHIGNFEHVPILDSASEFGRTQSRSDISNGRLIGRIQRRSPGGLSEIIMFQSGLLSGQSFNAYDSFGDWRVDVDNMSYEELLALSDRIGYVGTGLREEDIFRCIRKTKHSVLESLPLLLSADKDRNCSICQEEYEADDEVGKLDCGHCYHINCIKQWLLKKNACPVCKAAAAADN